MVLETVEFYISKCKPLEEYLPKLMVTLHVSSIDTSYHLTFVVIIHLGHLAVTKNILCVHTLSDDKY